MSLERVPINQVSKETNNELETSILAGKRILIAEDNFDFLETLVVYFTSRKKAKVIPVSSLNEILPRLNEKPRPHALILDFMFPEGKITEILPQISQKFPGLPVIVMTAYLNAEFPIESIKEGAAGFVNKAWCVDKMYGLNKIAEKVALAMQKKQEPIAKGVRKFQENLRKSNIGMALEVTDGIKIFKPPPLIGSSSAMVKVYEQIGRMARNPNLPVLITGYTGVGKEVVARNLHFHTFGEGAPFIQVNAADTPNLTETKFGGSVKGAYTGAGDKEGILDQVKGGTLFIDEVENMPTEAQAKLLRMIETGLYARVGQEWDLLHSKFRIISAINVNIKRLLENKYLRPDFFERIHGRRIHIPQLTEQERVGDILDLVAYFLNKLSRKYGKDIKITQPAYTLLWDHNWPGNVRELAHVIESAAEEADRNIITKANIKEVLWTKEKENKLFYELEE